MKVKPMIKITNIQTQVLGGKYKHIIPAFREASEIAFGKQLNHVTDSSFECFKDELEGRGVYVTWDAIERYFDVEF